MPKVLGFFLFVLSAKSAYADLELKINEFSAHPSSGTKEWIEFYNPNNVDLSSYFFDDDIDFNSDIGSSAKKSLSSLDNSTSPYPTFEFGSFLNNDGDYVVLFAPDGTIIDQYQYTKDPEADVSIGRSPDGLDAFTILSSATKGSQNSNPQPSPSASPPFSTSQSTFSTSGKSKSPSPSPKNSPSPISSKKTSSVLGSSNSATIAASPIVESSSGVSPTPIAEVKDKQSSNKIKIAGAVAGSGAIIMGVSVGLYLWYKRRITKNNSDKGST